MTSVVNSREAITYSYSYDNAARLTTFQSSLNDSNHPGTLLTVNQYNALGETVKGTLGNGLVRTLGYDNRGRLTSLADGSAVQLCTRIRTGWRYCRGERFDQRQLGLLRTTILIGYPVPIKTAVSRRLHMLMIDTGTAGNRMLPRGDRRPSTRSIPIIKSLQAECSMTRQEM